MKPEITYEEFEKLDLKVAEIKNVESIENKDKLLKLDLSLGKESRTIVAGIKQDYGPEELIGKKIIIIANLAPRKLGGILSQGMLLAADDNGSPILLVPNKDIDSGASIS